MKNSQCHKVLLLFALLGLQNEEVTSFTVPSLSVQVPVRASRATTVSPSTPAFILSQETRLHALAFTADYLDSLSSNAAAVSAATSTASSSSTSTITTSTYFSTFSDAVTTSTTTSSSLFTSSTLFSLDPSLVDSNVIAAGNVLDQVSSSISLDFEALKTKKYDFSQLLEEQPPPPNYSETIDKVVEVASVTTDTTNNNVFSTSTDAATDVTGISSNNSMMQTVSTQENPGLDITSIVAEPTSTTAVATTTSTTATATEPMIASVTTSTLSEQTLPDLSEQQQQQLLSSSPTSEGPTVMTALFDDMSSSSNSGLTTESSLLSELSTKTNDVIESSTSSDDVSNLLKSQLSNMQYDFSISDKVAVKDKSSFSLNSFFSSSPVDSNTKSESFKSQLSKVKYDSFNNNNNNDNKILGKSSNSFDFKSMFGGGTKSDLSIDDSASSNARKEFMQSIKLPSYTNDNVVEATNTQSSFKNLKLPTFTNNESSENTLSSMKDLMKSIQSSGEKLPKFDEQSAKNTLSSAKDFVKSVQSGEYQTRAVDNFRQLLEGKKSEIIDNSNRVFISVQDELKAAQAASSAELRGALNSLQSTTSAELKETIQSIQSSEGFSTISSSVKQAGDSFSVAQAKTAVIVEKAVDNEVVKAGIKVAKDVGSVSAKAVVSAAESEPVRGATAAIKSSAESITIGDISNTFIATVKFIGVLIIKVLDVILETLNQKSTTQLAEETKLLIKDTSRAVTEAVHDYTSFTINGFGEKSFAEVVGDIGHIFVQFAKAIGSIMSKMIEFILAQSGQPNSSVIIKNIQLQIESTADNISHTTILQAIENLVAVVIAVANFVAQLVVTGKTSLESLTAANDIADAGSNELVSLVVTNVPTEVIGGLSTVVDSVTGSI